MAITLQMFADSPEQGDPDCLCSYCMTMIEEEESPIRFWSEPPNCWEGRLHMTCFKALMEAGYASFSEKGMSFKVAMVHDRTRRKPGSNL